MITSTDRHLARGQSQSLPSSSQSRSSQLPPLVLEICGGQTRFPLRPVKSNRFLIGAGAGCDLQFGGDEMPPLHSIVHLDHVEALLETVTLTPPLMVNGLAVESVLLQDGDRISIGPFEMIAHRSVAATDATRDESCSPRNVIVIDNEPAEPQDVTQLSALQLVSLIEEEERQIEEFEQSRQLGAGALLDAVAERIDLSSRDELAETDQQLQTVPLQGSTDEDEVDHDELAHMLDQANLLTAELQRRSAQLADREAAQAELAEAVLESQHELSVRLESLVSRIIDLEMQQRPRFPKVA